MGYAFQRNESLTMVVVIPIEQRMLSEEEIEGECEVCLGEEMTREVYGYRKDGRKVSMRPCDSDGCYVIAAEAISGVIWCNLSAGADAP